MAGALPAAAGRGDRHHDAEGRLQPRVRLLHRDHARAQAASSCRSRVRAQADDQERRALRHRRAARTRDQDPQGRGEQQGTRIRPVLGGCATRSPQAVDRLQATAHAVADIDVCSSLATVAIERDYCAADPGRRVAHAQDRGRVATRCSKRRTPPDRSSPTTPTSHRRSAASCC